MKVQKFEPLFKVPRSSSLFIAMSTQIGNEELDRRMCLNVEMELELMSRERKAWLAASFFLEWAIRAFVLMLFSLRLFCIDMVAI